MSIKIGNRVLMVADNTPAQGQGLTLSDGYQLWQRISAAGSGGAASETGSGLPGNLRVAGRITPVGNPLND